MAKAKKKKKGPKPPAPPESQGDDESSAPKPPAPPEPKAKAKVPTIPELLDRITQLEGDLASMAVMLGETFGEPMKTKAADIVLNHQQY